MPSNYSSVVHIGNMYSKDNITELFSGLSSSHSYMYFNFRNAL